jgi:large subunit ribosomal protein L15
MQKNNLKRQHPNKKSKTVGRGGTRGKTAGRGTKGQNARAGHKKRPEIRDFIKRIPKLRGRGKNINTSVWTKPSVVNLGAINKAFKAGEVVSSVTLMEKGLIQGSKGQVSKVKVLGGGEVNQKLSFKGVAVSESAKLAIEKAGGSII